MNRYQYKDLIIEVLDEPTYTCNSADNNFNYSAIHFSHEPIYPTSKHGIKVYRCDEVIHSCVVIGSYGAKTIHESSSFIDDDQLVVCCSNTIFCLTLPDLHLKWKTQADLVTCFQILKQHDDYIVHGQFYVSKLNKDGKIVWQFGDVYVSINEEEFQFESDGILLTDYSGTKYKIGYNGKLIWDTVKQS